MPSLRVRLRLSLRVHLLNFGIRISFFFFIVFCPFSATVVTSQNIRFRTENRSIQIKTFDLSQVYGNFLTWVWRVPHKGFKRSAIFKGMFAALRDVPYLRVVCGFKRCAVFMGTFEALKDVPSLRVRLRL